MIVVVLAFVSILIIFIILYWRYTCAQVNVGIESPVGFAKLSAITPARIEITSKKRIPLIIHQTHKDFNVPINMFNVIQKWIKSNPEFEHRYYDDSSIEEIAVAHPNPRVLAAFQKLKRDVPGKGAIMADLFRLVIMERDGGVYADVDTSPNEGVRLKDFIQDDDEFISGIGMRKDLHQWCIMSIPRHPFLSSALQETLDAILQEADDELIKEYGIEGLTGPPRYNNGIQKLMKSLGLTNTWSPGEYLFHYEGGKYQYRIVAGDYMDNTIDFKYHGYVDDLAKMGLKHWSVA